MEGGLGVPGVEQTLQIGLHRRMLPVVKPSCSIQPWLLPQAARAFDGPRPDSC